MRKVYVEVIARHTKSGQTYPETIIFEGTPYEVDKVLEVKNGVSLLVGGVGVKYTIRVQGKTTQLFEEEGKWFVESKK